MIKKALCAIAAVCGVTLANAAGFQLHENLLTVSDGAIVPGVWNSNYDAGRDYADTYHVPLLVFYGGVSCGNCELLQRACLTDEFLAWQNLYKPVMIYTSSSANALSFAKPKSTSAVPFIGIYWNQDGVKPAVDSARYKRFVGRDGMMPVTTGTLAQQFIGSLNLVVSAYIYDGGEFVVAGTNENARLEVEAGYAAGRTVAVPLYRTSTEREGANTLVAAGVSTAVSWAAGEASKSVEVALPEGLGTGATIALQLLDSNGDVHASSAIYVVEPQANGVRNPYAPGEKTANALDWGDWTLDYAAAKQKVAAERANGGSAYILANFSGVYWCPYCNGIEETFLVTDEFKAWAKENHVIPVLFDQGKASSPGTAAGTNQARLLSYEEGATSIAGRPVASGAGYLSRKGIPADVAASGIALVTQYTQKWLAPGSTAPRIGNPTFLLIGDNDNVVARANMWRDRANKYGKGVRYYEPQENIARLNALLALQGTEGERDSYPETTQLSIAAGGAGVSATVQINAATKVFAVSGVPVGTVDFTVSGAPENRPVALKIVRVADGVAATLASGTGTVGYNFGKGETDGVYLTATAFSDGAEVGASGEFSFTVSSAITLHPGVVAFAKTSARYISGAGVGKATLKRTDGVSGDASVRVFLGAGGTAVNGTHFTWTDTVVTWEEGDASDKEISFALATAAEGESVSFSLCLADAQVAAIGSPSAMNIEIYNTDRPATAEQEYDVALYTGFNSGSALSAPLYNVAAGDRVLVKVLEGRLPSGVKLVYDSDTGAVAFTGTAKKPGVYDVVVAFEDVTKGGGLGPEVALSITVANPADVNRYLSRTQVMTLPLFATDAESGAKTLEGALTLSLKATNRITAKYVTKENIKNTSFSGKWDAMDDGLASTTLAAKNGAVLELAIGADGALEARVTDPAYAAALETGALVANGGDLGGYYAGAYTVAFPEYEDGATDHAGASYLTVTIDGAAKAKWTGMLANGQRVSGNGYIVADADGNGVLTAFAAKTRYTFAAAMRVKRSASSSTSRRAVVAVAGTEAVWEANGISHACAVMGSWHDASASLLDLAAEATLPSSLKLYFTTYAFSGSTAYGALADELYPATVKLEASKMTLDGYAANKQRIAYKRATGVFSGSVRVPFSGKTVTAKFSGVVIPGWYDCACDVPVPGDQFAIVESMPFAVGALVYSGDKLGGKSAKRGFPVAIGIEE